MSEELAFTGGGFKPFPPTYYDNLQVGQCSSWSDDRIERMVTGYWQFLERDDIQVRARLIGKRMLEHLGFEMDFRYGAYDYSLGKLEDEVCNG